jgi:sensor c-di-GMP phosphodiesterase-like protein
MMLSDSLKLTVLAEGVEEKGQVDLLRKVGCEYVQGYYFSKPLPVSDMKEFLDGWEMSTASEMGVLMGKQNHRSLKQDNNNEVG